MAGGLHGRTTSRTNFATEEVSGAPSLFHCCTKCIERWAFHVGSKTFVTSNSESSRGKCDGGCVAWVKMGQADFPSLTSCGVFSWICYVVKEDFASFEEFALKQEMLLDS